MMENSAKRARDKAQLKLRLLQLKQEFLKKQKKLQKYDRAAQAKAHVRQKLDEQKHLQELDCDDSTEPQTKSRKVSVSFNINPEEITIPDSLDKDEVNELTDTISNRQLGTDHSSSPNNLRSDAKNAKAILKPHTEPRKCVSNKPTKEKVPVNCEINKKDKLNKQTYGEDYEISSDNNDSPQNLSAINNVQAQKLPDSVEGKCRQPRVQFTITDGLPGDPANISEQGISLEESVSAIGASSRDLQDTEDEDQEAYSQSLLNKAFVSDLDVTLKDEGSQSQNDEKSQAKQNAASSASEQISLVGDVADSLSINQHQFVVDSENSIADTLNSTNAGSQNTLTDSEGSQCTVNRKCHRGRKKGRRHLRGIEPSRRSSRIASQSSSYSEEISSFGQVPTNFQADFSSVIKECQKERQPSYLSVRQRGEDSASPPVSATELSQTIKNFLPVPSHLHLESSVNYFSLPDDEYGILKLAKVKAKSNYSLFKTSQNTARDSQLGDVSLEVCTESNAPFAESECDNQPAVPQPGATSDAHCKPAYTVEDQKYEIVSLSDNRTLASETGYKCENSYCDGSRVQALGMSPESESQSHMDAKCEDHMSPVPADSEEKRPAESDGPVSIDGTDSSQGVLELQDQLKLEEEGSVVDIKCGIAQMAESDYPFIACLTSKTLVVWMHLAGQWKMIQQCSSSQESSFSHLQELMTEDTCFGLVAVQNNKQGTQLCLLRFGQENQLLDLDDKSYKVTASCLLSDRAVCLALQKEELNMNYLLYLELAETFNILSSKKWFTSPPGGILSLQRLQKSLKAIVGTTTNKICIWDIDTGEMLETILLPVTIRCCSSITEDSGLLFVHILESDGCGARLLAVNPANGRTGTAYSLDVNSLNNQGNGSQRLAALQRFGGVLVGLSEDDTLGCFSLYTGELLISHHLNKQCQSFTVFLQQKLLITASGQILYIHRHKSL